MKIKIGQNRRRRFMRGICVWAVVMTACSCVPGCATEIPELLEPVGVVTDTAKAFIGEISSVNAYEASVTPELEGAAFSVSGVVEKLHVTVGQSVRKGDVLITLDQENQSEKQEDLKRRIEQKQVDGEYRDMLSELDRRILELELEMMMVNTPEDTQAIAQKQMDIEQFDLDAELERELRKLEMTRLREELAAIEEQMVQNVLTAPIDGKVVYIADLATGSYVNAFASLIFIADDSRMYIETEYIGENTLKAAERIWAYVNDDIYELEYIPVEQKELFSKASSGETITTAFNILNPDDQIGMGDYAVVCLESGRMENALLIPRNALYIESSGNYVYLMNDGLRERREIELGRMTQHLVEIKSGLEEGDVVYVQE